MSIVKIPLSLESAKKIVTALKTLDTADAWNTAYELFHDSHGLKSNEERVVTCTMNYETCQATLAYDDRPRPTFFGLYDSATNIQDNYTQKEFLSVMTAYVNSFKSNKTKFKTLSDAEKEVARLSAILVKHGIPF